MEMVMNELDPREEPGSEEELVAGCAMLDSCAEIRTPDSLYNVLTHNFIRSSHQPSLLSLNYQQSRAQTLRAEPRPAGSVPARGLVRAGARDDGRAAVLAGRGAADLRRHRLRGHHEPGAAHHSARSTRTCITYCAGAGLDAEAHPRLPGGHLPALVRPLHRPRHALHLPGE